MATIRQQKAVKRLGENGGIVSTAMIDAGYSAMTAKTPSKLTDSEGFKELMKQELPPNYLLKKHRKLLDKTDKEGEIDVQAVSKGLDMAYKLGGDYAPDRTLNVDVTVDASPEIKELATKLNAIYGSSDIGSDGIVPSPMGDKAPDKE